MSDLVNGIPGTEPVSNHIGGGGRLYQDSRLADQVRAARAAAALDYTPWADRPEPLDDNRPAPPPEPAPPPPESEPAPQPAQQPEPQDPVAEPVVPRFDVDRRELASTVLELLGMAALTAGGFVLRLWLGLFIAGICLLVVGVLSSRRFDS